MSQTELDGEQDNDAPVTALAAQSEQALRVPCYCEENVWRLAHRKMTNVQGQDKKYYAVFVSNPSKCVCFFQQRANDDPLAPVFWDYHVLLLEQNTATKTTLVLDLDSHLPYPCPLSDYLDRAFPAPNSDHPQADRVAPWFRVVSAELYLRHFSSDRSHMWDDARKRWSATPPTYQPIQSSTTKVKTNLMVYVDMTVHLDHPQYGCVLTRQQLTERFL